MAVSANDEPTTVEITEDGAPGLPGNNGTDGAGFNQVRMQNLNNPLLHIFKTNQLSNVSAPTNTDSDITSARATPGTYADRYGTIKTAAINVIREEKDGPLIEPSGTNNLLHSETLTDAAWVGTRAAAAVSAEISPDGITATDKLVEDSTAANNHSIRQMYAGFTTGNAYTFSVMVKASERSQIRLVLDSAAFGVTVSYNFTDFSAGTIVEIQAGTNSSARIVPLVDDWYRCSVTSEATATAASNCYVYLMDAGSITYNGDGVSGLYLWGAQTEEGVISSYISTTTTAETRDADIISVETLNNIPIIDLGISISARVKTLSTDAKNIISLDTLSGGSFVGLYMTGAGKATYKNGDVTISSTTSINDDAVHDVVASDDGVNATIYVDGVAENTGVHTTYDVLVTTDETGVGSRFNGLGGFFVGNISDVRVYDIAINQDEVNYLSGV